VSVALLVVQDGALLDRVFRHLQIDADRSVVVRAGRLDTQLQRVQQRPGIPVRRADEVVHGLPGNGDVQVPVATVRVGQRHGRDLPEVVLIQRF
jgi:hypothetical protein